jgi:hypothetical protein
MDPLTDTLVGSLASLASTIVDRLFPDKVAQAAQRAAAQLAVEQLQQEGHLAEVAQQMSAILAEANSKDAWTSRARPSFLYVIYILLLMSIPMGILYAFRPAEALQISTGFQAWLNAIPDSLYGVFATGYLGYSVSRSWEKGRGVSR